METDLELKNIDDNQLKEANMVVDDENNLVDTEIQEVDGLIIDIDEEENLVATTGGLPKDKKKYDKSSKGNEVLQPKPSPNTKSSVRRLPKEVAKEKGLVKPKAALVELKVGKTKRLVEDKELEDERDSDVEGNESEEDSESEEDKETEVSKESDDSELGVKDLKIKGVKGNNTVVVSKAKKRMHVSSSSSEEEKVLKPKKVSKKKKQVKDVKKQKYVSNSSSYDDSSSSEEEKVLKPKKVSKKKRQVKDESSSSKDEDEKPLKNKKRSKHVKNVKKKNKKPLTAEQIKKIEYLDDLPTLRSRTNHFLSDLQGVPLGGTSIFDLPEIPLDDPFVKEWFKQFDPKPLKEIYTIIAGIDWCGFIHKCLKGSSEPKTLKGFYVALYLDSIKFDKFLVIRQRHAIRNWTTTVMNQRQELEIEDQVIGKLELHGEWTESELDQTEEFCSMIEEKISMISAEKIALEDLLKRANAEFQNDKKILQIILFIVDYGCRKHMTRNLKLLCNFVEKYMGTVWFGNDQFAQIIGYGDLVQGNIMIKRVYYVEGLDHNLFSVGQLCDANLEVAFRKSTCFVRDL
ncbi:hypothetical protein Tco_1239922 [Tanacetum coccineum]